MLGAVILLLAVFVMGMGVGNRITLIILNNAIKDYDEVTQIRKLKELTGYKNE